MTGVEVFLEGDVEVAIPMSGVAHAMIVAGDLDRSLRDRFIRIILDGLRRLDPTTLPGSAFDFAALNAMRSKRGRK